MSFTTNIDTLEVPIVGNIAQSDSLQVLRERTPDAQSALRDITSGNTSLSFVVAEPDSEDESPRRRRPRFLSTRSRSTPSSEKGVRSPLRLPIEVRLIALCKL